jgi:hypothetical protein
VPGKALLNSLKDLGCVHRDTEVSDPATHAIHPLVQQVADNVVHKAVETLIERSAIAIVAAIL